MISIWDPIKKESELQIIEMVLMCSEYTMAKMFKRNITTFIDKLLELTVLAGGAIRVRIGKFMRSEMYVKILINRAINKETNTEASKKDWVKPNFEELNKLRKKVEESEFTELRWSTQHKENCDKVTFRTTSGRICYWCISTKCFNKRVPPMIKMQQARRW